MQIEMDSYNQVYVDGDNVGGESTALRVLISLYNINHGDVAKEAGVSAYSLSRLLNGHRKYREQKDDRIFAAIRTLSEPDEEE